MLPSKNRRNNGKDSLRKSIAKIQNSQPFSQESKPTVRQSRKDKKIVSFSHFPNKTVKNGHLSFGLNEKSNKWEENPKYLTLSTEVKTSWQRATPSYGLRENGFPKRKTRATILSFSKREMTQFPVLLPADDDSTFTLILLPIFQ